MSTQVVFITGALAGIGRATALAYARGGGTPEASAHAIQFLGSDASSFLVGASLSVDGGVTAG